ncbi:MAG: MFS transporter [Anaerolineaceae bacterium]|nr:MFS transporter [Anaerolineaceae bacterium]
MQSSSQAAAGQGRRKWLILISVGIASFMAALDGSVVNTVLPVIREAFGSEVATVEWVVVVYLLVVSGILLTVGRLGDLRGHRPAFLSGFVIFVIGSALCGMAGSALLLVAFRVVQALGAAMLMANSPAILTKSFPATQRGQALGTQATMTYLGMTVGPSLGGWLAQDFGWRSIFYINVPVGLVALLLGWFIIPSDPVHERTERFDLGGALLFMSGLIALLLGLNQGAAWGWTSPAILGLLAVSMALLAVFIRRELRVTEPMLDLSLFRRPVFSAATASAVLNYMSLYPVGFVMPFYLIQGLGLNSAQAGLLLTAEPAIMAIVAPISGTLSDRIGSRLPATLGMVILAGGLVMLSLLGPESSQATIIVALLLCGLGTGIFVSPNNSALMGAAPGNRQGIAAGILATARNVGMALGTGLAGAILTTFLGSSRPGALYQGTHVAFLVAAGLALASGLTSALRGNGDPVEKRAAG